MKSLSLLSVRVQLVGLASNLPNEVLLGGCWLLDRVGLVRVWFKWQRGGGLVIGQITG